MKLLLSPSLATGVRNVPAKTLQLAASMMQQDWREEICQITQPTLLLYGGRSIYPGAGQWMAKALPHAKLEHFPSSGHALILEESQRTAHVIAQFFR